MTTGTFGIPGMAVREHTLELPLDHSRPEGGTVEVFARELVAAGHRDDDRPWLVWLQGGPGSRADRPTGVSGWLARALTEFRVLLLDQRGTGRSTPLNRQTLPLHGTAAQQAAYLAHFRADSVVADAEAFREHLVGPGTRWSVLGQSFGGFCALTYLSQAPGSLREVFVTGGLAALSGGPDPVYRQTYRKVAERTAEYFARFPDDERTARRITAHLLAEDERLPTGERLTPHRLQTLGILLGKQSGCADLHYLLEAPFVRTRHGLRLGDAFLGAANAVLSGAERPLYALLHESIYCQHEASRWSAHRVRQEDPRFEPDPDQPFLFTGEMFFPWQFAEDPALTPLADTAHLLAEKDDWPRLYDETTLAANEVPVAAAVYVDDMYVPFDLSMATAAAVRGLRPWVTNAYLHDGIRQDGARILDRLIDIARGEL